MELLTHIWVLSVMLVFPNTEQPLIQYWQHLDFQSQSQCHKYITDNKIEIVDSVLEHFREFENQKLINFEFFCQRHEIKGTNI
tara:strand:- start:6153 stop:6401 length:249 start_codon:yes stop_codon:yes gene_type:complete